jgi:hypothetical protein
MTRGVIAIRGIRLPGSGMVSFADYGSGERGGAYVKGCGLADL